MLNWSDEDVRQRNIEFRRNGTRHKINTDTPYTIHVYNNSDQSVSFGNGKNRMCSVHWRGKVITSCDTWLSVPQIAFIQLQVHTVLLRVYIFCATDSSNHKWTLRNLTKTCDGETRAKVIVEDELQEQFNHRKKIAVKLKRMWIVFEAGNSLR